LRPGPSESVPRYWEDLGPEGRIVFVEAGRRIRELDLEAGILRTLMEGPEGSWTTGLSASPAGEAYVVSYTPPPDRDGRPVSYPGLYELSGACLATETGCSADVLRPLLEAPDADEVFFDGRWASDGNAVYFSSYGRDPVTDVYVYRVELLHLRDGRREAILKDAVWMRPSRDGSQLVYVSAGEGDSAQALMVSGPNGEDPAEVFTSAGLPYIDSPMFSAGGDRVIFSAVGTSPAAYPWWEKLAGVVVAEAHAVPSDWWSINLSGGMPTRLTQFQLTGLTGDISPDGGYLAFGSSSAVYIIRLSDLGGTLALNTWAGGGLAWLP
jgi:hypothetical protein